MKHFLKSLTKYSTKECFVKTSFVKCCVTKKVKMKLFIRSVVSTHPDVSTGKMHKTQF